MTYLYTPGDIVSRALQGYKDGVDLFHIIEAAADSLENEGAERDGWARMKAYDDCITIARMMCLVFPLTPKDIHRVLEVTASIVP